MAMTIFSVIVLFIAALVTIKILAIVAHVVLWIFLDYVDF